MSEPQYWRLTMRVTIKRPDRVSEFRHHSAGIPGSKREAVRHFRKICRSLWPSAKLRIVAAKPDRIAETKAKA